MQPAIKNSVEQMETYSIYLVGYYYFVGLVCSVQGAHVGTFYNPNLKKHMAKYA